MEEINLEKIKEGLVGIKDHVNRMIKKEEQNIRDFEGAIMSHYTNDLTEEDLLEIDNQYKAQAENTNKEIDRIMENLKDKFRALGLSEEEINKQVGK